MTYKQKLAALRKQRQEKLDAASALMDVAGKEDRGLNSTEEASFNDFTGAVEGIDRQIKSVETMERLGAGSATGVEDETEEGQPKDAAAEIARKAASGVEVRNGASLQVHRNLPKGTAFTRYAMAVAASKGNLMQAEQVAKTMWGDSTPEVGRVLKAAVAAGNTTDATWAKPLVDYKYMAEEFIELLRPETILGKIQGLRRVPFNVRMARQTAGSTVNWVGEGNPKPVSKLAFDTVSVPETKIAGIVVLTMELARFSSPSAEAVVRADMIEAIAAFTDRALIDPSITGNTGVNPPSITNGATSAASTGGTLAEIDADLLAARLSFVNNNIPLASAYWVMNPATRMALEEKRTSQDVLAFPDIGRGILKGIPIIESNAVGTFDADGAGAGTAGFYIALISAPNILLADDGQVMLDSSSEASISMTDDGAGTTMTSLWQRNMIGLRAERLIHWLARRANSVYVITNVQY